MSTWSSSPGPRALVAPHRRGRVEGAQARQAEPPEDARHRRAAERDGRRDPGAGPPGPPQGDDLRHARRRASPGASDAAGTSDPPGRRRGTRAPPTSAPCARRCRTPGPRRGPAAAPPSGVVRSRLDCGASSGHSGDCPSGPPLASGLGSRNHQPPRSGPDGQSPEPSQLGYAGGHNPKVAGSNPAPATTERPRKINHFRGRRVSCGSMKGRRSRAIVSDDDVVWALEHGDRRVPGEDRLDFLAPGVNVGCEEPQRQPQPSGGRCGSFRVFFKLTMMLTPSAGPSFAAIAPQASERMP